MSWQEAWRLLGLARYKKSVALPPVGWWLSLSAENLRKVAAASGLPESTIQRMLLRRYVGTVLPEGVGPARPWSG